ncbi:hypothetical protein [Pseudomonas fluorescens]|uniref:hypothetical protein n=1 Tax=Pseudomonas fluorescens TaxID=294 RepID=UPI0012B8D6E1|nr:hypothetical protein [Pseudomonas fluorescens]
MLNKFLFKRPDWFKYEGYWRLAQVLRLGPAVFFLVFGGFYLFGVIVVFVEGNDPSVAIALALAWFAGAVAYVVAVYWLLRLVVWIADGFKDSGRSR